MRVARAAVLLLVALAAGGCSRVVDPGFPTGPERLVVEGRIERREGSFTRQTIQLTTTAPLRDTVPPPVTDAVVSVTGPDGVAVAFRQAGTPGIYEADVQAVLGGIYRLDITWRGDRYRAVDTLRAVPPIDALNLVFSPGGALSGDPGLRAAIDYTDPAGIPNWYQWQLLVDGRLTVRPDPGNQFRLISEDRFYDGGIIRFYQPFDEIVLQPNTRITVRQLSIGGEAYRYLFALLEQDGSGSPFSTPPAVIRGNVGNLTDPSRPALGFFFASDVSERGLLVPLAAEGALTLRR